MRTHSIAGEDGVALIYRAAGGFLVVCARLRKARAADADVTRERGERDTAARVVKVGVRCSGGSARAYMRFVRRGFGIMDF